MSKRATPQRRLERAAKEVLLPLAAHIFVPRGARPGVRLASAERVLLIRQDNRLGNLVLLTPFLQALRQLAPQAHIALLTGEAFAELFAACPWVDAQIIERKRWLIRHPWAYPGHLARIRKGGWQITFELGNADTHSFSQTLQTAVSGSALRVGFDHPSARRVLNAAVRPPTRECHYSLAPLLLLSALGAEPPIPALALPPTPGSILPGSRDPLGPDKILVHPGGRGPKAWPAERFAALVHALQNVGSAEITVIGGRREAQHLERVAAQRVPVRAFSGLAEFIAALRGADLYIGCDAGPLHVAAAARVPTISLFLRSHPLRYAPLGAAHEAVLLGPGSRAWMASAARPPRVAGAADSRPDGVAAPALPLEWDPAFAEQLYAQRPRIVDAPPGLDAAGEVAFLRERVLAALRRTPSAGSLAETHVSIAPPPRGSAHPTGSTRTEGGSS